MKKNEIFVKYITIFGILLKVRLVLNDLAIHSKSQVDMVDTLVLFS